MVVVGAGVGRLVEALALDTFQDARGGGALFPGGLSGAGAGGPFSMLVTEQDLGKGVKK